MFSKGVLLRVVKSRDCVVLSYVVKEFAGEDLYVAQILVHALSPISFFSTIFLLSRLAMSETQLSQRPFGACAGMCMSFCPNFSGPKLAYLCMDFKIILSLGVKVLFESLIQVSQKSRSCRLDTSLDNLLVSEDCRTCVYFALKQTRVFRCLQFKFLENTGKRNCLKWRSFHHFQNCCLQTL